MKIYFVVLVFSLFYKFGFPQTTVKMEKVGSLYFIPCEVNGLMLKFIVDTGASDVSISISEALFMLKNGYLENNDIKGTTYFQIANGDVVEGTSINIRTLKIGNWEIYNVDASITHSLTAPLLLGQSALQKIGKFSFDYANNFFILDINSLNLSDKRGVFNTYINYSREYKIDYPNDWIKGSPPANNDGLHFWSIDNKIDFFVYSSILRTSTFTEDYNLELKDPNLIITYKLFRSTWYIISGIDKKSNKIVYKKVYWNNNIDERRTMLFQYSSEKKIYMDEIIKIMVSSFKDI